MDILLPENETMSIDPVPENLRIVCRSGRVWLTQTGDSRDFLLREGEAFTATRRGQIVLWALAETRIEVSARAQEVALRWQPALKRA
jgi:serine/threonine protein phosphatase PrpC